MSLSALVRAAANQAAPVTNVLTVATHSLADLGVYFVANNAATGVATAAAPTAYSDTAPLFTLYNADVVGSASAKLIYLDWIRFYETAAGTGGVDVRLKAVLDATQPSAGTAITPKNVNMASAVQSIAQARILPTGVTQTAASRVVIGNHLAVPTQTTPLAVLTEVNINFGGIEGVSPSQAGAAAAAVPSRNTIQWPSMIIGPGQSFSLQFLITTQSAASTWAVEAGWLEA